MLPLAFALRGRPVLVLGAGKVGAHKARQLLEAGSRVTIISEEVRAPLPSEVDAVILRRYRHGDLEGFSLVVSALGDATVNDDVVAEAERRGIWINVVDDLVRSTFFFTAMHREGDVVVSVSTGGASPALARMLRTMLVRALPENVSDVATKLRLERRRIHGRGLSTEDMDWSSHISSMLNAPVSTHKDSEPGEGGSGRATDYE